MAESPLCKRKYVVDLTQEQKDTLIGICTFHGLDIEFKEYKESESEQKVTEGTSDQSSTVEHISSNSAAELTCSVQVSDPSNRESSDTDKCPYCLSCPCVTLNVQSWLGQGRLPQPGNNLVRKKLYRKYWSMLDRRGVRSNPLYLERKPVLMQDSHVQLTVREVMPECVLAQVRGLYPNPNDTPYMGHFW